MRVKYVWKDKQEINIILCKFFFNDLLLCLHCRTPKHTWLHMFVIVLLPSAYQPYPHPSVTSSVAFGYSCSRPLPTCAVHECKSPYSFHFLFFIFFFCRVTVCALFFVARRSLRSCTKYPCVSLYPGCAVSESVRPRVWLCICVSPRPCHVQAAHVKILKSHLLDVHW